MWTTSDAAWLVLSVAVALWVLVMWGIGRAKAAWRRWRS